MRPCARLVVPLLLLAVGLPTRGAPAVRSEAWPSFRGASAVADGHGLPVEWSVRPASSELAWRTEIPGLGHSSPIVQDGRVYVVTVVARDGDVGVVTGNVDVAGIDTAADRAVEHAWHLVAVDLGDGDVLWDRVVREGVPRVGRHVKSSHASATPATDGERIVALMGSEGLFCFDMEGALLWRTDLGLLDVGLWGEPDYQWGPASSPVIQDDLVFVQNDRHEDSFVAAYDLETGEEVWRADRDEKPAWSTPTIYRGEEGAELVTNGANWIRAYEPRTGEELWRLSHGDLEVIVPSPVVAGDRVIVTGGYPAGARPIYAVRPGGDGDITPEGLDAALESGSELPTADGAAGHLLWMAERGSPYTPTPLAYRGILYVLADSGILSAHDLETGERLYRTRLAVGAGFSASPVASDGKIYLPSEDGDVFVVRAGPEYELLARNDMGEVLMATPAIADGTMILRGLDHLFAIRDTATSTAH